MSLHLYLVAAGTLDGTRAGDVVVLDGPEGRHAATVKRTQVGERLRLSDGAGRVVTGAVASVERDQLTLRADIVEDVPEPSPRFVLVQALAKGDRDDQAIEAATELGVDEVVPWQASRSIVQWRGDRGAKAWAKWDAVLVAATKQSRRPRRPILAPAATTTSLVTRICEGATAYVLHEDADAPLASLTLPTEATSSSSWDLRVASLPRNSRRSATPGPRSCASVTRCFGHRALGRQRSRSFALRLGGADLPLICAVGAEGRSSRCGAQPWGRHSSASARLAPGAFIVMRGAAMAAPSVSLCAVGAGDADRAPVEALANSGPRSR